MSRKGKNIVAVKLATKLEARFCKLRATRLTNSTSYKSYVESYCVYIILFIFNWFYFIIFQVLDDMKKLNTFFSDNKTSNKQSLLT